MNRLLSPALVLALLIGLLAPLAVAQPEVRMGEGVALTVYNANFATVKERRFMDFDRGVNVVKFIGVAKTIDATSVHFTSLTAPKAVSVLEQNYEFDLVSADKILEKYLDKKISLTVRGSGSAGVQEVTGTLKSFIGGQLVLTGADGGVRIVSRSAVQDLRLGALPDGLLTRPTLVWKVGSKQKARHLVKVAYIANGVSWKCDYIAVINKKHTAMDFSGWVTINNQSGATYKDARIKLIAGDVRRVTPVPRPVEYRRAVRAKPASAGFGGFVEKSFAEYHMYTLGRPSTVNMNQVKQIELIEPALNVPILKYYWYPGGKKINVKLEVQNKKEAGLGIALPKGKVRVHQKDEADGSLEFIGEDRIDHTPKDEKFTLYIGDAFDIIGETKTTKSQSGRQWRRQTVQIELRNHKDSDIVVRVPANLGRNWRLESQKLNGADTEFKVKKDAWTVVWYVPVKKNAKSVLTYVVYTSW